MMSYTPTADQIRAAENLLAAMAHEDTIRPIVEAYEQAILEKHRFHIDRKWVELGTDDRVILDRKDSFLMSDEDSKVYHAECFAARDAAGLKVENPEFCPLLVAENVRIQAQNALLDAMAVTPGLETFARRHVMTMELRSKAIDLSLKLLAPFVGNADMILGRILKAA